MIRIIWSLLIPCLIAGQCKSEECAAHTAMKKTEISIGMELNEALTILRSRGIDAKEVVTATIAKDNSIKTKEYIVRPLFDSEDALIVLASGNRNSKHFRVANLTWHIKYAEDAKLPKLYRADRMLELRSVDVNVFLPNDKAKRIPRKRSREKPFD